MLQHGPRWTTWNIHAEALKPQDCKSSCPQRADRRDEAKSSRMYLHEINDVSWQFFLLLWHTPLSASPHSAQCRFHTSCEQRYHLHAVLFQFSCMTPKKVASASMEMRTLSMRGLSGITNSSSSSWCSCTMPVTKDMHKTKASEEVQVGDIMVSLLIVLI